MRVRLSLAAVVGTLLVAAGVQAGEGARPALSLFQITATPEPRELAFDRALRDEGPAERDANRAEILPDGSVRYARGRSVVTVTVKNPCPPGTAHFSPPPLPGRRLRE